MKLHFDEVNGFNYLAISKIDIYRIPVFKKESQDHFFQMILNLFQSYCTSILIWMV